MKVLRNITESYILNRTTVKIMYVLITVLVSVPYLSTKLTFPMRATIIYGFIVLGYELITGKLLKTLKSTKTAMFLGGFILSYLLTILINQVNFISELYSVAFMTSTFALFFLFPEDTTKEDIIKEIKIISATIVSITFLLSFISFILYVFSISGSYVTDNGGYEASYGLIGSRLWGLYNPNTSATYTVISIILSFALMTVFKKKRIRIPLSFNIIIQYSVLLLTGSRAGLYTMAGATAFYVLFFIIYRSKKSTIATAFISATATALSLFLFLNISVLFKEGLAYLPSITNYVISLPSGEEPCPDDSQDGPCDSDNQLPIINKIDLNRDDLSSSKNNVFFANRIDIWESSLTEFLEQPIFGIGRNNIPERASDNLEHKSLSYYLKYGNTHNIYLCILVSSGILGFLLMGSFAAVIVIRSFKTISKTYKKINIWFLTAFIICLMFFANEFVESRILYKVSSFGVIFWIYCGYLYKLSKFERIEHNKSLAEVTETN